MTKGQEMKPGDRIESCIRQLQERVEAQNVQILQLQFMLAKLPQVSEAEEEAAEEEADGALADQNSFNK